MKKTLITLIALAGIAHADFIWNGGESITQELWQTESSWTVTGSDSWPSAGTARPIPTHGLLFPFPARAEALPSWKAGH